MKIRILVLNDEGKSLGGVDLPIGGKVNGGNGKSEERMTDAQRRYLFRLLSETGFEGEKAKEYILMTLGLKEVKEVTKAQASSIIEKLKEEAKKSQEEGGLIDGSS